MNTGLLTSICAVASLISVIIILLLLLLSLIEFKQITAAGNTFIYIAFFFCLGRRKYLLSAYQIPMILTERTGYTVYSNSLMAILNARQSIRNMLSDEINSISLGGIPQSSGIAAVSKVIFAEYLPWWRILTRQTQGQTNNIAIKVDTTLEFTRDGGSSDPEVRVPAVLNFNRMVIYMYFPSSYSEPTKRLIWSTPILIEQLASRADKPVLLGNLRGQY